jgi:hypothetical protein
MTTIADKESFNSSLQNGVNITDKGESNSEARLYPNTVVKSGVSSARKPGLETSAVGDVEVDPEDNWPSVSVAVFEDWGQFLQLGIPGALSLFMEWCVN